MVGARARRPRSPGSREDGIAVGRMKLMLFGSTPSAIHATFTPAPVIPSERAVGCRGLSESVFVELQALGIELHLAIRTAGAWELHSARGSWRRWPLRCRSFAGRGE